jgi:hypothetical protein
MAYMMTHNTSDDGQGNQSQSNHQGRPGSCGGRDRERAERGHQHRRGRRKERVLHTRISEQLSDDIRRLADDLRVPTSNLVRNVLEEVFSVVESVSEDVGDLFDDVLEEADAARDRVRRRAHRHAGRRGGRARGRRSHEDIEEELRRDEEAETGSETPEGPEQSQRTEQADAEPPSFPDVIGWQPLVLNHDRSCAGCGRALRRGERAFLGLTEQGLSRTTLCGDCTRGR